MCAVAQYSVLIRDGGALSDLRQKEKKSVYTEGMKFRGSLGFTGDSDERIGGDDANGVGHVPTT